MCCSFSWVEQTLHAYGLPVIFGDLFFESLGLPLPGETLLLLAGTLASRGELALVPLWLTAFAAAVLGDNTGYLIGRRLGRPAVLRYGARIGLTEPRLARVERVIQRHGMLIVTGARFVAVLRQLNGIAAGTAGMPWGRFLIANALGAALWVSAWIGAAWWFGVDAHALHWH
ncbi:MAG TPA: DedA family protein [Paenirhodobacter sp.]